MKKASQNTRGVRRDRYINQAALACAVALGAQCAMAADIDWVRAANNPGAFNDPANWAAGLPGPGDNGYINNGGIATAGPSVNSTLNDLRLGFNPASSGSLTVNGGTITANGNMAFGSNTTGAGTLNISSGAINVGGGATGDFIIGDDGAGTAIISGGVINTRFAYMGKMPHGHGDVTQTGGQFLISRNFVIMENKPADATAVQTPSNYTMSGGFLSVGQEMYIGAHGPATFNLSGTGSITVVGAVHIAASGGQSDPPAGTGTLNMSGGTFIVSGAAGYFVVGDHGDGTFNMSGGFVGTKYYNTGQNFELGFPTRGTVNHTGGSVLAEYAWVVGEESRSANLYDLSGGTVTVTGAGIDELPGDLNIASGAGGRGTLQVRGTGVANIGNAANVGNAANTNGTITISAGTIALGQNGSGTGFLVVGIDGNGTFLMSGGNVSADGATFGQNANGLGIGSQTGGTAVFRSNMSVGEASTKANVYDINAGTLTVGTTGVGGGIFVGSSGVGTFRVGGTARVTSVDALTIANAGTGTVAVSGGSLTAGGMINKGAYGQTGGVASLAVVTGTGSISVSGGTLNATSIAQGTLAVSGTGVAKVALNGTNTGLSVVNSLSVTGSGKLDLTDNDLIVHNGSYATITTSIASARAGGAWSGAGITSSAAAAAVPKNKTLGTLTGAQFTSVGGSSFDGVAVVATDVLVKFTYYGDTDFNGLVNFDDYSRTDAGFNNNRSGWLNGDFDYNGIVNFDDYSLIDLAFNTQSGSLRQALAYLDGNDRDRANMNTPELHMVMEHFDQFGLPYAQGFLNAVPEPTSMSVVGGLVSVLACKRRRRSR